MKLGKREIIMLYALGLVIVIALVFLLAIWPMMNSKTELEKDLSSVKLQQQARKSELANLEALLKQENDLMTEKADQEAFFFPYNDSPIDNYLAVINYLLVGDDFDFQDAGTSNGWVPEQIQGQEFLYVMKGTITIKPQGDEKITVGQFYKFKENIANNKVIKSAVITEESLKYEEAEYGTPVEEYNIIQATATIEIYMIKTAEAA